jgi:hypothetical protein
MLVEATTTKISTTVELDSFQANQQGGAVWWLDCRKRPAVK